MLKYSKAHCFLLRFSYISQVDVPWIFFKPLIHFQSSEKLDLDNFASQCVLRWPQLAVTWSRTWVPSQRLRLAGAVNALNPNRWTSGQWQRSWPFGYAKKELPQRWKVMK